MIALQQLLSIKSDILKSARVKLVRHKDSREEFRYVTQDREQLLKYQAEQPKHVFKGCDYIVSFIGVERGRSILFGVFKVNGFQQIDDYYHYDLSEVVEFDDLVNRLVIDWGKNAIAWHQWHHTQQKEVLEILPAGYIGGFPGLTNFVLAFSELQRLTANPEANYEWKHHLAAVNGIYLILDERTGQQYIGSACGKEGIWQRWNDYAKTYTGGNTQLIELLKADSEAYKYFKFSILQSLPSNMTQRDVIAYENLYKSKLGSRANGLNAN